MHATESVLESFSSVAAYRERAAEKNPLCAFLLPGGWMETLTMKARQAPRGTTGRRKDARVIVNLEPALLVRLKGLAAYRGMSLAAIGSQLIETALTTTTTTEPATVSTSPATTD